MLKNICLNNIMLVNLALLPFYLNFANAENVEPHFIEKLPNHYNGKTIPLDSCFFLYNLYFNNVQLQLISWKQIDEKEAGVSTHIETEHKIIIDENETSFFKELIKNGTIEVKEIGLEDLCGCLGEYAEESISFRKDKTILVKISLNPCNSGFNVGKIENDSGTYYILLRKGYAKELFNRIEDYKIRFGCISQSCSEQGKPFLSKIDSSEQKQRK
ncbi:MAG: hypothetical protein GX638_17155 [Crenarchaeota archaeon]|nr:hypothetical protein [Thermoproteota archaeon]